MDHPKSGKKTHTHTQWKFIGLYIYQTQKNNFFVCNWFYISRDEKWSGFVSIPVCVQSSSQKKPTKAQQLQLTQSECINFDDDADADAQ